MADTRSLADVLQAARERINDKRHFFMGRPGAQAWNSRGHDCNATDPDAARWTGRGAVAAETTDTRAAYRLLDRAAADLNTRAASCTAGLCCQPHDVALRVFDRAITMAEATS